MFKQHVEQNYGYKLHLLFFHHHNKNITKKGTERLNTEFSQRLPVWRAWLGYSWFLGVSLASLTTPSSCTKLQNHLWEKRWGGQWPSLAEWGLLSAAAIYVYLNMCLYICVHTHLHMFYTYVHVRVCVCIYAGVQEFSSCLQLLLQRNNKKVMH